ncbi:MAG: division/cell wall cluster transcriptional repressor MraZ [Patescibacteria group bacterium]
MFIGEYFHTIDEKGRVAVPTKFRSKLVDGVVITRGLDNCLFLYTLEEWKNLADKLSKLSISKANTRAFSRLMLAGAMDLQLDKQGRIIIPDYLRKYANIKKKAVITGLFNRLEIWDQEVWEKYKDNTEKTSENIAEALDEL